MPIIEKCKECGREGGYGKSVDKKICARCEKSTGKKEDSKSEQTSAEKKK